MSSFPCSFSVQIKVLQNRSLLNFCASDACRKAGSKAQVSRRASREGPWLCAGEKSNTGQQEVKAEFIERIKKVQVSGRLREGVSSLFGAWRFLLRIVVGYTCPLEPPGTELNKARGPAVIPWKGWMLAWRHLVLVVWSFSALRKSLTPVPHKEDVHCLHSGACVEWGAGPSKRAKTDFYGALQLPYLSMERVSTLHAGIWQTHLPAGCCW